MGTSFGVIRIDAMLTNVFDNTYYFSGNASRYSPAPRTGQTPDRHRHAQRQPGRKRT